MRILSFKQYCYFVWLIICEYFDYIYINKIYKLESRFKRRHFKFRKQNVRKFVYCCNHFIITLISWINDEDGNCGRAIFEESNRIFSFFFYVITVITIVFLVCLFVWIFFFFFLVFHFLCTILQRRILNFIIMLLFCVLIIT